MALGGTLPEESGLARDVFHVVVSPSSKLVTHAVMALLEGCDRVRWYPSLLVEEHDANGHNRWLAQAARRIGVPVMSPRSLRNEPWSDRARTFLDEWFYVRNAHASLLHVHAPPAATRLVPVRWLRFVMPRLPIIESVYISHDDDDRSGHAEIHGDGIAGAPSIPIDRRMLHLNEVNRLYETAVGAVIGN